MIDCNSKMGSQIIFLIREREKLSHFIYFKDEENRLTIEDRLGSFTFSFNYCISSSYTYENLYSGLHSRLEDKEVSEICNSDICKKIFYCLMYHLLVNKESTTVNFDTKTNRLWNGYASYKILLEDKFNLDCDDDVHEWKSIIDDKTDYLNLTKTLFQPN